MLSGTTYVPLLSNIPPDQLPFILDKLREMNVSYKLENGGTGVAVPPDLVHSTQMALMMESNGSKIGNVGLELFQNQEFGVTSYQQKINFQRALQGELMRSINSIEAVRKSKVILALPQKKTFLEEGGMPKASVVVDLQPGKNLTPAQIKGITNLVASAVEGLDVDNVAVVDARGKLLSRHVGAGGGASGEVGELKEKTESSLEERIEAILSKVVGTGKVIARVNATLNTRDITSVEEVIDPDKTAVRSIQSEEESLDGARTNPAGVPGARANLPGAQDQGQVGFQQNVKKELKTTNYEVPKTVRNIKEAPGQVTRVNVAVLVDGVYVNKADDKGNNVREWKPRSEEDLQKYEALIKNALGIDEKRGDTVKIENIRFSDEDFAESDTLLSSLERKKLISYVIRWAIVGLSLGLFFFLVIRPFMRWITESFQDSVDDMLPKTIEELEELQSVDSTLPGLSGALPMLEEAIDPDKAESELLKERIMSLVTADNKKAANALGLWLVRKDG